MLMNLLFVLAILIAFAALIVVLKAKKPVNYAGIAFEKRETLFTPAERSFLGVLEQSIDGSRYRVFGKVRLGDIVKPAKGLSQSKRQTAQNKVNQKHVDFVICKAGDLAVVGVVELDDKSHEKADRAARDEFVDQVLAGAKIPFVHFPVKNGYAITEMKSKLVEAFKITVEPALSAEVKKETTLQQLAQVDSEQTAEIASPTCPKCAADMVKRQAKNGPHEGKLFWACSTYPKCRQVVPIE